MDAAERFYFHSPAIEDYWRGIVLFGRNVASYKFALTRSLLELRPESGDLVRLEDLAEPYSKYICEHLKSADKQGTSGSSRFLEACRAFNQGTLDAPTLKEATVRLGFNNVIDAFHVVNQAPVERVFFVDERRSVGGLRVTDDFSRLLQSSEGNVLASEPEARWRLVETAWELGMARHSVTIHADPGVDALFVLKSKARRAAVTTCRSALNGYQKGRCFYCYRPIDASATTDVDRFFPHVLKQLGLLAALDGVWNLVLACRDCNGGGSTKLPVFLLPTRARPTHTHVAACKRGS